MGWINYDVWKALNGGDAPVTTYYALLASSYDSATFTAVTLQNTDIISFSIKGLTDQDATINILQGASSIRFLSGNRLQLITDAPAYRTVGIGGDLYDGLQHYVEVRLSPSSVEVWIDGDLAGTGSGAVDTSTFSQVTGGAVGVSIFGVTLGYQASWAMLSDSFTINSSDLIGSNDLTYVNAPTTPVESDFMEVTL